MMLMVIITLLVQCVTSSKTVLQKCLCKTVLSLGNYERVVEIEL